MSARRDNDSLAAQAVRSMSHLKMMVDMSEEDARKKLELFQKMFPRVCDYCNEAAGQGRDRFYSAQENMFVHIVDKKQVKCTGGQSASQRPAKSLLVGSTPTPCSKVHGMEVCPRCGYTPGPYHY